MSHDATCTQCSGEGIELGKWAGHLALRCRECGWTYYAPEFDRVLSEAWGQDVYTEPSHPEGARVITARTDRDEYGEWWHHRVLVEGPCSDREALYAADCPSSYSSGPGRGFANSPVIRRNRSGSRVIVSQTGGLDV